MKRFLVFASPRYYPTCGWGDLAGSFDELGDAISAMKGEEQRIALEYGDGHCVGHVVDTQSGLIVERIGVRP